VPFVYKQKILVCILCIYAATYVVKYKAQSRTTEVSFNCSRCTELTEVPGEANLERQELIQVPPLSEQFKSQKSARIIFLRLAQFQYLKNVLTRFCIYW